MIEEELKLTPEQFGQFWKYIENPMVTDVDYNGRSLWITDQRKGCYKVDEDITEQFIVQFTHDVSNVVNKQFNQVHNTLEADSDNLRITLVNEAAAPSGTSICIRKSPPVVRNTIKGMVSSGYCSEEVLNLLINCVRAKMNIVFGGEPGTGKTEAAKFFQQFIRANEKVITIEDVLEMHYSMIYPDRNCTELRISKDFTYQDAIKVCLRNNPTWLMLSEARSTEVKFLMEQWSTGVHGFSTIHMEDIHNLPDRILNMMERVADPERMENRIYRAVNVGILIRRVKGEDGSIRRYMEQVGFYVRENHKNRVYMIVDNGEVVSRELPEEIKKKFREAEIQDPFSCECMDEFLRKEKERNERQDREENETREENKE